MAATEEVPKTYAEATTRQDQDEWKKAIASELDSLIANKTWKLVPKPTHQRPIGCCWVFALKRGEKGRVVRYKARLVAKEYSQRYGIDYEETYSPVAYLNSVRAMLAKCGADGMEIEQCDVDTAFLYGKLEEEIYMKLPKGCWTWLVLKARTTSSACCSRVCMDSSRHRVFRRKRSISTSRVWCLSLLTVYTRGEGDDECIVCLYVDDMLIASRQKPVIVSIKAVIAEKFRIKDLGRARFILGIRHGAQNAGQ
ncbi:hypothetical protein PF010_g5856 [Phytophthora fragariae]|uniref:Reverse transcriptase Ty1/copia-type domain-containing protein n=1 Tax=Phytophthora fragariae TaxID=53985 RepID=A0A6A3UFV6_9STRA|nr:hypothetical protein PF003_g687 [Phytophthora fragariae]KAE8942960.1 hypothetical protein PF009_g7299 [Phytophthora fragariae]KAE9120017.1 hypothetical protein PF007_g8328 [Phytophthora fragariae]KAE9124854.1 hypothetical protein PF010_g5856 [Phytophthora fragariae]KAE9150500.1 hypothetical protein PF006_g5133 [Phytophthora fragariae]